MKRLFILLIFGFALAFTGQAQTQFWWDQIKPITTESEKTAPVAADKLVLQDSEDSDNWKYILVSKLTEAVDSVKLDGTYIKIWSGGSATPDSADLSALTGTVVDSIKYGADSYFRLWTNGNATPDSTLIEFTETNDLGAAVIWAIVPDAYISESSVTQHEAALSVTAEQVSNFDTEVANNSAVAANTAKTSFPGFTSLFDDYGFTDNSNNWNTAYGWGDHSGLYVPLARTITINGTSYDLSANRSWTIPTASFGTAGQMPYTNATANGFSYNDNIKYNEGSNVFSVGDYLGSYYISLNGYGQLGVYSPQYDNGSYPLWLQSSVFNPSGYQFLVTGNGYLGLAHSPSNYPATFPANMGFLRAAEDGKLYYKGSSAGTEYDLTLDHSGLYVPLARELTINGTTYDLSANRSWTIATPTYGSATQIPVVNATADNLSYISGFYHDGTDFFVPGTINTDYTYGLVDVDATTVLTTLNTGEVVGQPNSIYGDYPQVAFASGGSIGVGSVVNVLIVANGGFTANYPSSPYEGKGYIVVNRGSTSGAMATAYNSVSGSTATTIPANSAVTFVYSNSAWYQISVEPASGYLTSEDNNLTTNVTWATVPDAYVSETSVTQHEAALTVTANQVSDFDTEVANNSAVAANTAKVTNATHTGEVTGSTTLTIAADAVDDTKIDWGTGTNQVSTTDMPEGNNLYYTETRVSANTDVAANTAKTSNATHTGEVTGSTALTIAADVVDMDNIADELKGVVTDNDGAFDWMAGGLINCAISNNTTFSFTNITVNKNLRIKLVVSSSAEVSWNTTPLSAKGDAISGDGTYLIDLDTWGTTESDIRVFIEKL